ncbi:N-acetylmuramoyl-L-alanine amidase LytC precursor [Oxobacter pfennigii]|uniref:N-acetylmuramoyl-L-alanine amidase LytC n=1 Tax=Oxobacter pfennigii TaxID=36849 RepID=A0A0P8YVH2_9CLOT|nr:cell wall-binding repeat-containing protein [Oxobacter pfennigii]KPU43703.1 N-acetylmuramoyl-L-alanine amidase LytC precursor [Oxobacter pfennigii]
MVKKDKLRGLIFITVFVLMWLLLESLTFGQTVTELQPAEQPITQSEPVQTAMQQPIEYTRLSGKDRYETSVKISQHGWPKESEYAVIARGDDFPDALCAGPLAKKYDAPILLTPSNMLHPEVSKEIERLGVTDIIIVGGAGAISYQIEEQLISRGINVERIAGADRYETSVKIAEKLGKVTQAVFATGTGFPDSLSISSIAAYTNMPILLTDKHNLNPGAVQYMIKNKIKKAYIIGGEGVIASNVQNDIKTIAANTKRLSGSDRFETNVAVMDEFKDSLNFKNIYLAVADGPYGDEFADALSGSVLASYTKAPVILVYEDIPQSTLEFVNSRMANDVKITALGGEAVVPEYIVGDLLNIERPSIYIKAIDAPLSVKPGDIKYISLEVNPKDAKITAAVNKPGVVSVSILDNSLRIRGVSQGFVTITLTAKRPGYKDTTATLEISPCILNVEKNSFYDTIQDAVNKSSPGDTIKIASGTYNEHIVINKDNLKLIGYDRDTTIIDATQDGRTTKAGIKIVNSSGVEIRNLTVRNAGVKRTKEKTSESYGIFMLNSDKSMLDNLYLRGNGEYEVYLRDGCDLNVVQNCIIDGQDTHSDYWSLDGIFSQGGESGVGSLNDDNKFISNTIRNVVYGISLTACKGTQITDNSITAGDHTSWQGSQSVGIIISNSSDGDVNGNTIKGSQFGIRMSILSGISPYAYAGTPDDNNIMGNEINTRVHGIRVMGSRNKVENNHISGNALGDGIWLADTTEDTKVIGNTIIDNDTGIFAETTLNEIYLNKISSNNTGVKNSTDIMLDATRNYWGDIYPKDYISANVDYSPWLGSLDDAPEGFKIPSPAVWHTDDSLQEVYNLAQNSDIINLYNNTYILDKQFVINKDLTIKGMSRGSTIIKINYDTDNSGDGRGVIFVEQGKTLSVSNLTIDGTGHKVMEALRISGYANINNIRIKSIAYDIENGWGIYAFNNADINIRDSYISEVKKVGIGIYDNAQATIGGEGTADGNTFGGELDSAAIQYAVHVKGSRSNSRILLTGNTINNFTSQNNDEIYSTAGVFVEEGSAEIKSNKFNGCSKGIQALIGAWVNGSRINESNAKKAGQAVDTANNYTNTGFANVVFYNKSNGRQIYPRPEGASAFDTEQPPEGGIIPMQIYLQEQ